MLVNWRLRERGLVKIFINQGVIRRGSLNQKMNQEYTLVYQRLTFHSLQKGSISQVILVGEDEAQWNNREEEGWLLPSYCSGSRTKKKVSRMTCKYISLYSMKKNNLLFGRMSSILEVYLVHLSLLWKQDFLTHNTSPDSAVLKGRICDLAIFI